MEKLTSGKEKKSKKRHSSLIDTVFNNTFEDSLINVTPSKKKKKKRKHSVLDLDVKENLPTAINENLTEGKPKEKKNKKRHSSLNDSGMNDSLEDHSSNVTPGKKKKKKKHSQADLDFDDNVASVPGGSSDDLLAGEHAGKKKKKKKLLSVSNTELTESWEDVYQGSSPKKKKKRKSRTEEEFAEDENGPESSFKDHLDLIPKHKKKHKESLDGIAEKPMKSPGNESAKKERRLSLKGNKGVKMGDIPQSSNGYIQNLSTWSQQEELALIDQVLSNLDSKDTKSYRKSLDKMNWKDVAINGRTPKECCNMIENLIRKIKKYKTLAMVLAEAKEKSSNSALRLKEIKSAKGRFISEYREKHKSDKLSNSKLITMASAAWSELSSEEKKPYEIQYVNEVEKQKKTMDLPPDDPRTPFTVYYFSEIEKGGTKGKELRAKCLDLFKNMKIKDKSPHIRKSCEEWAKYITEFKKYKELHSDFDKPMLKLTSTKLFQEYFEYLGMPKKVTSVVSVFMADMIKKGMFQVEDSKSPLMVATSMYSELSEEEKAKYNKKRKSELATYNQQYKTWRENVDGDICLVLETYFPKSEAVEKKNTEKFEFNNVVEVTMAKPKFNDEPEKPASSPFRLFHSHFKRKRREKYNDNKEMEKACSLAWKALPKESKSRYMERCTENRASYKESLLQYVCNLGDVIKTYLGFKRKEHYNFFKEDIFKDKFPNNEYPVYLVVKREFSPLKDGPKEDSRPPANHTNQIQNASPSDNESSDDDSSEEENADTKKNLQMNHQQTTAIRDSSDCEDSFDEADNESDIGQAWETPKKSLQNTAGGKTDDSEDGEEDSEDSDEDSDSE